MFDAELTCSVWVFFRSMLAVSQRRYVFLLYFHCCCNRPSLISQSRIHKRANHVPSQVMWNAAVHAEYLHDHSDYGFEVESVRFSWE